MEFIRILYTDITQSPFYRKEDGEIIINKNLNKLIKYARKVGVEINLEEIIENFGKQNRVNRFQTFLKIIEEVTKKEKFNILFFDESIMIKFVASNVEIVLGFPNEDSYITAKEKIEKLLSPSPMSPY